MPSPKCHVPRFPYLASHLSPPWQAHAAHSERNTARDAAAVIAALETRAAVTLAWRARTLDSRTAWLPAAVWPVLIHLAATSLLRR